MEETKTGMLLGMRLICLLYILSLLGSIFAIIMRITGFLDIQMTFADWIINIGTVAWILLIIISIFKRFKWGWYLILVWCALGIISPLIHFFFSLGKPICLGCYLPGLIITIIIVTYICRKRSYFNT